MECLQTKQAVTRSEIQRLSEELQATRTEDQEPEQEETLEDHGRSGDPGKRAQPVRRAHRALVTNANLAKEYQGV